MEKSKLKSKRDEWLANNWMKNDSMFHRYIGNHDLFPVLYSFDLYFKAPKEYMKLTNETYIIDHSKDGWDTYIQLRKLEKGSQKIKDDKKK